DPGPFPIPPDAMVEGGRDPSNQGDRHVLIVDTSRSKLYEFWQAIKDASDNDWSSSNGATFDLSANKYRPDSWTSADAAGLPIFPGLVRYDEVQSGEITHAVRFTTDTTCRAWIFPARHQAGRYNDTTYPPMGLRLRLKAGFDLSPYKGQVLVILKALKKYGMILADNGSSWFISGATDTRWNDDTLSAIKQVPGSAFEVVDMGYRIETDNDTITIPGDSLPTGNTSGVGDTNAPVLDADQLTNGSLSTILRDTAGLAQDGNNKTGIGWIYSGPAPDTTYNFNDTVLLPTFQAGDSTARVHIQVSDLRNNAHGALYVADRLGNHATYYFNYIADSVAVSKPLLDFGNVPQGTSAVDSITIRNPLLQNVTIDSIWLLHGKQFSIVSGAAPPAFTLQPGTTRNIAVKFNTVVSFNNIVSSDTLMVKFDLFSRPLAIVQGTSATTGVNEPMTTPEEITLSQNIPNPFADKTVLHFTAPDNTHVLLNVYDMLGRQVAVLVNGFVAGSEHSATFSASGMPAGIYIARLQTGSTIVQRMMQVLR
ncbi:MAG TPA: T9SS type A sorting domain-containing protein, partial [Candidatus Kapabacteria bacterium]|nr:T9SS type A sorting domain-containing protein [Candidatus Kapabacteria bacterium]